MKTTFKKYVTEAPMTGAAFADAISKLEDDNLKVGFEFEVIIPSHSAAYVGGDPMTASMRVDDMDGIDELIESGYFKVSSRQRQDIKDEFEAWQADRLEEWVNENWEDFQDEDIEDDEERKETAREVAKEDFERNNGTTEYEGMDKWLQDEWGGRLHRFASDFDLEPTYGWHPNEHLAIFTEEGGDSDEPGDEEKTHENFVTLWNNQNKSGPFMASGTPNMQGKFWGATRDGSLSNDDEGLGVEVITPPMPYSQAMASIDNFFAFLEDNDMETSDECGLHVGISFDKLLTPEFDPLKLALFLGEEFVLDLFNRNGNAHAQKLTADIHAFIVSSGNVPASDFAQMRAFGDKALQKVKFRTANLGKLTSGYIEFRAMGGENYHRKGVEIKSVINRFATALHIACSKDLYFKEYAKKLYKLINKSKDSIMSAATRAWGSAKDSQDFALVEPFVRLFPVGRAGFERNTPSDRILDAANDLNSAFSADTNAKYVAWASFVFLILAAAEKLSTSLSIKEKVAINRITKQLGVKPREIITWLENKPSDDPQVKSAMDLLRKEFK